MRHRCTASIGITCRGTWMFWTSALAAPVMAACVYYGIPASRRPRPSGPTPSFAGFLYASAGLALLFAALDQGQRLDWWRSSVFTALFASGTFFLLCAMRFVVCARRTHLVDLPYPPQMEHDSSWHSAVRVPLLPARDGPGHPAVAGRTRISTPRSSVQPCCGRRCRSCVSRSSRPTC